MTLIDVILLVLLGAFVMYGLWFGLIHALGSLVGAVAGTFIAGVLHVSVGEFLSSFFGSPATMKIISFLIIFFVISKLTGFFFHYLSKVFDLVTHLPFIHSIDRLFGGIIGFFEGVLVIGLALFVISKYQLNPGLTAMLDNAKLIPWFINASALIQPFLPRAIKGLRSYMNY